MKMSITLPSAIVLCLATYVSLAGPDSGKKQQGPMEKLMAQFDANQDGQITRDEVRTQRTVYFKQLDSDGNGLVSLKEFQADMLKKKQQHLKEYFDKADANKDGLLSVKEFQSAMPMKKQKRLEKAFNKADTNGDGVLSFKEFDMKGMDGRKGKGKKGHQDTQPNFKRLDKNKDGQVSLSEFTANLPMFDKFDANKDGIITLKELKQKTRRRQ